MTQETRSCLALLTCSLPSTGRDLSQAILSDFAEKPQVLRLRLAPRTRQTPLRMTVLLGFQQSQTASRAFSLQVLTAMSCEVRHFLRKSRGSHDCVAGVGSEN